MKSLVVAALAGLALAGCTGDHPEPLPEVELPAGTGVLTLTPAEAAPGDTIELTFPHGTLRGAGYTMATGDGDTRYWLAVAYGGRGPTWSTDDERPVGAIGFEGPGPELLQVPGDAQEGEYLLCDYDDEHCAVLTVTP